MNKSVESKVVTKKEVLLLSTITTIIFLIFLVGTGSISSGYHMIDDHVAIELSETMQQYGFFESSYLYIVSDLNFRFRPLYSFCVCVKTLAFGPNMAFWMFVSMLEGIASFVILYLIVKLLHGRVLEALLFAGISVFGMQFTPWYRAFNQENTGTLFFSLSLFFIAMKKYKAIKNNNFWIVLFAILASLQKEAYSISIPSIILFELHEYWEQNKADDKNRVYGRIKQLIKDNLQIIVPLSIVFFLEVVYIRFFVGMDYGYAGFSESSNVWTIVSGINTTITTTLKIYFIMALIGMSLVVMCCRDVNIWEAHKKYVWLYSFGLYGIVVELVAHARSGMWERYLFPFIIIFDLIFVFYILRILRQSDFYYQLYVAVLIVVLIIGVKDSWVQTKGWSKWGHATEAFYLDAKQIIDEYQPNSILVYLDPSELDMSTAAWLRHYCEYTDYQYYETSNMNTDIDYDVILIYKYMWDDEGLINSLGIDKNQYIESTSWDAYTVAYKAEAI